MRKTLQEILFQPKAWENTLQAVSDKKKQIVSYLENYRKAEVVLTGCGSSYYLPLSAASLYTKFTGEAARGLPASEILLFPETIFIKDRDYLLITISRTGKTPETLAATRFVKENIKGGTLLITCTEKSIVAEYSDLVIFCPQAAEETKYMTKSFTSMLIGFQLLTAYKSGDILFEEELYQLPRHGENIIARCQSVMERFADKRFTFYIFLGHGPLYGIAAESMLKVKEMACTPAEAYHGMELMHGPKYAVNKETLVIYLLSDSVRDSELRLLHRIKELGGHVGIICDKASPQVLQLSDDVFEVQSGLSENARLVLVLLLMQLYAYYRSLAVGKDIE